jgi:hypothetical protein
MANKLKMATVQPIQQLHAANWSQRRIARELGIDRGTVARYVQSLRTDPNAAISPAGSDGSNAATFPSSPAPGGRESGQEADLTEPGGAIAKRTGI